MPIPGCRHEESGRSLGQCAPSHPGIRKVWVDGGYRQHLVGHAATLGIDMEITARTPGTRGFTPIPKRWAVERTYGWLMLNRRLARDYETLSTRSEAMIHLAMTDLMARRLTSENTISWRDPTRTIGWRLAALHRPAGRPRGSCSGLIGAGEETWTPDSVR